MNKKNALLLSSCLLLACNASAAIYGVTLSGDVTFSSSDGSLNLGEGKIFSSGGGGYNTVTGDLSFGFTAKENVDVFGTILQLQREGSIKLNLFTKKGVANISSCSPAKEVSETTLSQTKYACDTGGYGVDHNLQFFDVKASFDINKPYGNDPEWGQQVNFTALGNNSQVTAAYNFSMNFVEVVDSSDVPVPATVWLFGSALLGLRAFRKR